jgi:DNA-binding transcriptional MerR regulator
VGQDKLKQLYFRIGEVARIVGVEPHVLRYWESEFRSIKPQKSKRGQRVYSRKDVEALHRVKDLLYAHGFTIAGARKKLREGGIEPAAADGPSVEQTAKMREALLEVRGEIVALMRELDDPPAVDPKT